MPKKSAKKSTKTKQSKSRKKGKKNTGVPYEIFIRDLYKSILAMQGDQFRNINVQHNVQLDSIAGKNKDGSPLKRQIDVYWEFELAGSQYKVCIQAKDMDSKVKLGMVDTFRSVLDDIAGQPRGIMVSRKGYQSGADSYAQARGIEIFVLKEQSEEESPSRVNVRIEALNIGLSDVKFFPDDAWFKRQKITSPIQISMNGAADDLHVYDRNGDPVMSFSEVIEKARPDTPSEGSFTGEYKFRKAIFIKTGDKSCPLLKITHFQVTVRAWKAFETVEVKRYVNHIFKNAAGTAAYWVDNTGTIRKEGEKVSAEQAFEIEIAPGVKRKFRAVMTDAGPKKPSASAKAKSTTKKSTAKGNQRQR